MAHQNQDKAFPSVVGRGRGGHKNNQAVALVIVLAFVVLLTGLVLAFFSRAMAERQVSNSSANLTRVDLLAQGATDQIIADLKQEMAAGSIASSSTVGGVVSTVYTLRGAACAMPALVASTGSGGRENVLKISRSGSAFYPATANYNNLAGPNRASSLSTSSTSQNGRYTTAAKWNQPLMMPISSGNDFSPNLTAPFTFPDWVMVDRSGSNPVQTSINSPDLRWSGTGPNTVIGRYAYTIYHEGGLLDVNVAGYPIGSGSSAIIPQGGYKPALSYADLTQIGLTQVQADQLVGWRNYGSAQAPGTSFATPAFVASSGSNYYNYVVSSTSGFLNVSGTNLSDRMFTSRRELIHFAQTGLGLSGTALNALNYLTTFSRDLNQPTYAPDPGRPKIRPLATGGNDMVGRDLGITGADINPSFLLVRVPATPAVIRNDGSRAIVGEPLVKKRFALNRLAWLTYQGPSSSRNIASPSSVSSSPDYDIWLLENKYNITQSFLQQGNAANIYRYFGLSWITDNRNEPAPGNRPLGGGQRKWVYNHQLPNPASTVTTSPVTSLPPAMISIMSLSQVAAAGREPDFFELLKASITAGSLGKPATAAGNTASPGGYQNQRDISVDAQVIQIAANIIDQFDTDGVPTRILFNNGLPQQEYSGIEDLPYLYAVFPSLLKVQDSTPTSSNGTAYAGTIVAPNDGIALEMQHPEIWNPHALNFSGTSLLGPRPANFRIFAYNAPPAYNDSLPSPDPYPVSVQAWTRYAGSDVANPIAAIPRSILAADTELDFSIPSGRSDLFREPTMLNKPNVPQGSLLQAGTGHFLRRIRTTSPYSAYNIILDPTGAVTSILQAYYPNVGAVDNQLYLGTFIGSVPLKWNTNGGGNIGAPTGLPVGPAVANTAYTTIGGAPPMLTYRLECQDPATGRWIIYDEKFVNIVSDQNGSRINNFGTSHVQPTFGPEKVNCLWNAVSIFTDPRSSRFSAFQDQWTFNNGGVNAVPSQWPLINRNIEVYGAGKAGWADTPGQYVATNSQNAARQNAVWTARPDELSGFPVWFPTAALGFYSGDMTRWRIGMAAQNNPNAQNSGGRFHGFTVTGYNGYNGGEPAGGASNYFADADGVVRRGMSAYLQPIGNAPSGIPLAGAPSGNPMQLAGAYDTTGNYRYSTYASHTSEYQSRPIILNRPFRTVAELGYAYSDTPWRNLDFFTPESGDAGLLDVFCIADSGNADGLVAGKVNLNTKQATVLQAILAGAYKDEFSLSGSSSPVYLAATGSGSAASIAQGLVARTSAVSGTGMLINIADLVGRWGGTAVPAVSGGTDGGQSYIGFSGTTATVGFTPSSPAMDLGSVLAANTTTASGYALANIQRFRESSVRALGTVGQARVWNLLIDVVAQTGRYPRSASSLNNFIVEGEQRYWVHVAIDRITGQVLDKQIEVAKE